MVAHKKFDVFIGYEGCAPSVTTRDGCVCQLDVVMRHYLTQHKLKNAGSIDFAWTVM